MTPLSDPTERIAILRTDLERWQEAFVWAHGHLMALDLSENYRQGRPDKEFTRLTRIVAQAHDRIDAYLENENESLSTE